jgi:hypothetical protein
MYLNPFDMFQGAAGQLLVKELNGPLSPHHAYGSTPQPSLLWS